MRKEIKNSLFIGALIGLVLAILIGMLMFLSFQKGYGTIQGIVSSIILIPLPPIILGFIIGLMINKETRPIGISALIGGIIGVVIGELILFTMCFPECYGIHKIILTFGGPLFLKDFALGLWIILWWFIVGASILGFIIKSFKK